jgi:threonine aldolase
MTAPVDLRSDTVTRPTPAMRRAMADCPVGDDVFGEDPTVRRLEELAAERVGKAAALFVPSGTMGNLLAVMVHCSGGFGFLAGDASHVRVSEAGGYARLAGAPLWPLATDRLGGFDPAEVARSIHAGNPHLATSRLLCIENTHNFCGGVALEPERVAGIVAPARERGLALHLDGARVFNAATALGVPARELAAPFDSVMFCLSKGLCAPVGSVLCGCGEFVAEARARRKMLGGGMRQAGVLAACGLISLGEMVERLAEDHANARFLAGELAGLPGVGIDMQTVQTNMVVLDYRGAGGRGVAWLRGALAERGVLALARPAVGSLPEMLRLVLHNDVSRADCARAVRVFREVLGG